MDDQNDYSALSTQAAGRLQMISLCSFVFGMAALLVAFMIASPNPAREIPMSFRVIMSTVGVVCVFYSILLGHFLMQFYRGRRK